MALGDSSVDIAQKISAGSIRIKPEFIDLVIVLWSSVFPLHGQVTVTAAL